MRFKDAALFAGLVCATVSGPAEAATTLYDFSFTETDSFGMPAGSFSGQFGVEDGLIDQISGSGAGIGTITRLFVPGSIAVNSLFPPNDNVFSMDFPYLTFNGVTFSTSVFNTINLYNEGSDFVAFSAYGDGSFGTLAVTAVSDVPLPASAPLFGAALAALTAIGYGMKRKTA